MNIQHDCLGLTPAKFVLCEALIRAGRGTTDGADGEGRLVGDDPRVLLQLAPGDGGGRVALDVTGESDGVPLRQESVTGGSDRDPGRVEDVEAHLGLQLRAEGVVADGALNAGPVVLVADGQAEPGDGDPPSVSLPGVLLHLRRPHLLPGHQPLEPGGGVAPTGQTLQAEVVSSGAADHITSARAVPSLPQHNLTGGN